MWRFALTLDYDGVDDYVRANADTPCLNPDWRPPGGHLTAVLGDDGRHHLFRDQVALCTGVFYMSEVAAAMRDRRGMSRGLDATTQTALGARLVAEAEELRRQFATEEYVRHDGRIPHDRICSWWTDGTSYRMFAPKTAPPEHQRRPLTDEQVTWSVGLVGGPVDPSTVPPSRRCTFVGGRSVWPAYLGTDRLSRIRQQLTDHAGPLCHACGRTTGMVVDHDHFTGMCRGLVCWDCNAWLDTCPHLKGCPWAEYLNAPPALGLQLRHPQAAKDHQHDRARIDYLGFDPIAPARSWTRRR
ncbi:endonuclease VII domain-containing protein [Amycolatopsis roodepoortensis]|uniref:endonuclease VII domain-containing protein n=1 Tax=Amycolatopsis roodepoortensis TaxID=700274 RepID=UPI00214BC7CE|nr:endonuclease VII domain-containing protein [Amycolatopsis roodepoortensis]UUV32332.1 endonuclease VII domain-containing protein [Amycolatopsis roodepoortensis]